MTGSRKPASGSRADAERAIDDELAFHCERTIEELTAHGLDAGRARAEAARRFGSHERYRQRLVGLELRQQMRQRRRAAMEVFKTSFRSVARGIRRAPGFVAGVVAILTLGLGANAITFGLVDRLVLSGPSGVEAPADLRRIVVHRTNRSGAAMETTELGYLDYRDLLAARQLAGAAGETSGPVLSGAGEAAERLQARLVTAGYFPLLGVHPAVGRFFTTEESERDGARVVVLSHAYWQRRFGGDPAALGRLMHIESDQYTIVGVAPRYFTGTTVARVDVFLPLEAASDTQVEGPWRTSRNFRWMGAIVRLAPGADESAAAAEITALHRHGYAGESDADSPARLELSPLNPVLGETAAGELGVAALVAGVALLVLVIAFANVANLFLARSLRHHDQVAVRLAVGGTRARLVAEQAIQGALLALIGALIAVLVAVLGAGSVQTLLFPDVHWLETPVNLRALIVLAGCAVAGGALAAAFPIWQAGRTDVVRWLRTGTQRASRPRSQRVMLAVQGALSVMLLVGAGLFIRSLQAAQSLPLGIEPARLLAISMLSGDTPPPADFRQTLRDSIVKVPGVDGVTQVAGTMPFVSSWATRLTVPGLAERPAVDDGGPYIHAVEPGYFATVGTGIVEGRGFTPSDRDGTPRVAIVNRTMARLYWPGEVALGKCLQIGPDDPPCSTVVGIAENTRRQAIVEGESLLYYVPIAQAPASLRVGRLIVRTRDASESTMARVAETIRREALRLYPGLRYVSVRPLDEVIAPQLRAWRLGAGLFSVFGVLALGVAAVGLYSVVAFGVEGRRREIGIRAALGASSSMILRLIVGDGLRLAAAGVVAGLVLAGALTPLVSGLLYGVPPRDVTVFAGAALVLIGAAAIASVVPALRAAHLDPSRALRED